MVPLIWCILYTNKVIKGNAKLLTRISWCCLFSYFISELWGDGLWAYPQLSSYSWWGCDYYVPSLTKLYFKLYRESWCMWAILLIGQCSVRHPADALDNLFLGSFDMVDLRLWDALSRWRSSRRIYTCPMCMPIIFLTWAHQLMYVHDQLLIVISSSGTFTMLGIGSGPSKLW